MYQDIAERVVDVKGGGISDESLRGSDRVTRWTRGSRVVEWHKAYSDLGEPA